MTDPPTSRDTLDGAADRAADRAGRIESRGIDYIPAAERHGRPRSLFVVLFSGDAVYDDVPLDTLTGSDPSLYSASLRRLRELPVRVVRPGHGPSFGAGRLHLIIDRYLKERP